MKTLILVRHAKSSWAELGTADFDRPLNERGKRDAPEMAGRVLQRHLKVDQLVSSPALRALTTARYFAETLGFSAESIRQVPELYHPTMPALTSVIEHFPDAWDAVMIFSHNPTITEFVNTLTPVRLDNMPTCAVFAVSLQTRKWQEFQTAARQFLFFDYPKAR